MLASASGIALAARGLPVSARQEATPVTEGTPLSEQHATLDGKERIWQINRVIANADDAEEFRVRLGFLYAHEIPVTVDLGDETVDLAVGDALAIQDRDEMTVVPTEGSIGSCYTLELIDPEDVNNSENRLAIGSPFPTTDDGYQMALYRHDAAMGISLSLGTAEVQSLLLLLEGNLTYTRENGEATTLGPGEAASGSGGVVLEVGDADAVFLIVDLALDEADAATPASG
jgi:hypothetical protein